MKCPCCNTDHIEHDDRCPMGCTFYTFKGERVCRIHDGPLTKAKYDGDELRPVEPEP